MSMLPCVFCFELYEIAESDHSQLTPRANFVGLLNLLPHPFVLM